MTNENFNLGFVAFNNPQDVEDMIVSLKNWHFEGLNRCLLVDHSTIAVAKAAIENASRTAGWKYISNENRGFGAGVNTLVSMSSDSDVLISLNLDVRFCRKPPFSEMAHAINHDAFSLVGTSLLDTFEHPAAGRLPPLSSKMLLNNYAKQPPLSKRSHKIQERVHDWQGAVHGACFAVKTQDFQSVGGIDERLFLYAEEFDLQSKFAHHSKSIGFIESDSIVHHSEGNLSWPKEFINTYNLRYLAMRERKIGLLIYYSLSLLNCTLKLRTLKSTPWISLLFLDLDRQAILRELEQLFANEQS